MYLRIYRNEEPGLFWKEWAVVTSASYSPDRFEYPLLEGIGFCNCGTLFDHPECKEYDPARCGAFADWLEENEDRLLEGFSTEDRPLATERLQALRQWLRSGFQPKE